MDYPTPSVNALLDGAQVDMRVKFAMQVSLSMGFAAMLNELNNPTPADAARLALNVSDELYKQASERGWVEPLSLEAKPAPEEIAHARRNADLQVAGQLHGQSVVEDYRPRVAPSASQIMAGRIAPRN